MRVIEKKIIIKIIKIILHYLLNRMNNLLEIEYFCLKFNAYHLKYSGK